MQRWFTEQDEPDLRAVGTPEDGVTHLRQYLYEGRLADPAATRYVVGHYWQGCSCGHRRAEHAVQARDGGRCGDLDSYGLPCECPSFELSQEEREQADPDGDARVGDYASDESEAVRAALALARAGLTAADVRAAPDDDGGDVTPGGYGAGS